MFELLDVKYQDILNLPSLVIEGRAVTTLVGPSGCGKTTLLKLLNKLISPTQGRILFQGMDLHLLSSVDHRRKVMMLSQNPVMFAGSIEDNLVIGFKLQGRDKPPNEALRSVLTDVKLDQPLDGRVEILSGGEKQRLAIARVLLLNPEVYLLDEPSSALDETTAKYVIKMLAEHVRKAGKTMVMVTHSPEIAARFSDTIIELSGGRCSNRRRLNAERT